MAPETATATGRGRPREFEPDAVLDAAVQLFWEQGYEATSIADIVDVTGLSKSSLYGTFGSKDELFDLALNRYVDIRTTMVTGLLTNGTRGLDDLKALFDLMWSEVSDHGDHRGCLAVNTSTELGLRDGRVVAVGQRFRDTIGAAVQTVLERAAELGEIDSRGIDRLTRVMQSSILGLAVLVRGGAPDVEIEAHLDALRDLVESWRIIA